MSTCFFIFFRLFSISETIRLFFPSFFKILGGQGSVAFPPPSFLFALQDSGRLGRCGISFALFFSSSFKILGGWGAVAFPPPSFSLHPSRFWATEALSCFLRPYKISTQKKYPLSWANTYILPTSAQFTQKH